MAVSSWCRRRDACWTIPERPRPTEANPASAATPAAAVRLQAVSTDPKDRWHDLGSFIREQRGSARLSLRRLSELAGISNPYLSQIERGLRRPSAEILQQIAKALRISAETLYVQAGHPRAARRLPGPDPGHPGRPDLSEEQKQALVRIYLSFRREHDDEHGGQGPASAGTVRAAAPEDSSPPPTA